MSIPEDEPARIPEDGLAGLAHMLGELVVPVHAVHHTSVLLLSAGSVLHNFAGLREPADLVHTSIASDCPKRVLEIQKARCLLYASAVRGAGTEADDLLRSVAVADRLPKM